MINNYISSRAIIHPNSYIGRNVNIYGNVQIEEGVVIEDNCIIGKPSNQEMLSFVQNHLQNYDSISIEKTTIRKGTIIGSGTIIYSGACIAEFVEIEDYCKIGSKSKIGSKTRIMYNAQIYNRVSIGENCRISGFICNETVIEDFVSFFGKTVHKYKEYTNKSLKQPTPIIKKNAIVGFDTILIGGIVIGENAYIGANLIISSDIEPNNKHI